MGDAILAHDDGSIGEGGGNVVGEVGVDGWDDTNCIRGHAADTSQEVDGAFKASTEKTCPG